MIAMKDLTQLAWIKLKGVLLSLIGVVSGGLLLAENWTWKTVLLSGLCRWGVLLRLLLCGLRYRALR